MSEVFYDHTKNAKCYISLAPNASMSYNSEVTLMLFVLSTGNKVSANSI